MTIWYFDAIARRIASDHMKMNSTKTEFMWCCTSHQLHLVDDFTFILQDHAVPTSASVRNLDAFFDQVLILKDHVNHVNRLVILVRSCFISYVEISPLSGCSRYQQLFNLWIASLFHELIIVTIFCTEPLQSLLNVAARLIYGHEHFDLKQDRFHWLWVLQQIIFKYALLAYKAKHGLSPQYIIKSFVQSSTREHSYALCSAMQGRFVVLKMKNKFGERSFAVSNSLPDLVKDANSISIFNPRLMTYLFGLSYHD